MVKTPQSSPQPASEYFSTVQLLLDSEGLAEFEEPTADTLKRGVPEGAHDGILPWEIDAIIGQKGVLNELGDIIQDYGDTLNAVQSKVNNVDTKLVVHQQANAEELRDLRARVDKLSQENARQSQEIARQSEEIARLTSQHNEIVKMYKESENRKKALVSAADIYCQKSSECLTEFLSVVNLCR